MLRTILFGTKGRTIEVDFRGFFPLVPVSLTPCFTTESFSCTSNQQRRMYLFHSKKMYRVPFLGREPQKSSCTFTGWDGMGRRTTDPQQVGVSGEGGRMGAEALSS